MENRLAIEVEGVGKRYGRGSRAVQALRGVSIAVRAGEIYGLLGRNGAGKTTLIKVILDIVRADAGATKIRGVPSRSPAARRAVGYLPEDHRFPDYRTGDGALRFYAALSGCDAAFARRRAAEVLEIVGLRDAARRKIRGYSKGMRQRLGLAQALVHDPQVLFLDEPTDGVDPVGRAQIRNLLVRLKGEGRTIFLNSHLLSETERLCDRVGILESGELVRQGTIEELTQTERVFNIRTSPAANDDVIHELRDKVVTVERVGEDLDVGVATEADIDGILDLLRARGLRVLGFQAKKLSLEDVFLEAVDERKGGA